MKTNLRFLALSAAILSMFTACQREELEQNQKPENLTHSVTFVAGAPETKTTVDISDEKTAKFKWTKADEGRFTAYENGTEALETVGVLDVKTGIMSLVATFDGKRPESASYVAVVNKSNATQTMSSGAYDEIADILVSKAVSSFVGENGVQLQFKREVAIAKMTLKKLDAGEIINKVTVSSNAEIAGSYGVDGWASSAASSIEISSTSAKEVGDYKIVANEAGEAVVWFTCIPQDAATLTVKVEAADGDTYTKEFKPITLTSGDVKAFGVAMTKDVVEVPSETYNRITSQSELEAGEYVIGMALNSAPNTIKYLVNTTKAKPGCTDITGDISVSEDGKTINLNPTTITNAKWLIESVEGGFSISSMTEKPAGLATTSASDGLTTQTTYLGTAWSITVDGETNACTMKYVPTSRYLNVYSLANPRTYTSASTNNNGKIYLYKRYDPRTALATPTNLAVSAEKAVSWNAVEGAASYVLTIGTEEYSCLSNLYDASAIADEYYDVAVVAVPKDTDNYKNSAAATLTDAKFGTPTLATPTLAEGAVDEFSVNATWTVDSKATAGYNCELYKGETKVGDSKTVTKGSVTFDGLDDGVTYTVKVNAIAVEGTKAYAASAVAKIDLTTKGTTKISEITAAGTYTVKNAVVYAVANTGVVIIGDGTGLMVLTKSSHGYKVGDAFSTVAGTVAESNGIWQFNNPTVGTKTSGSAPDYGTPVEATSDYLASKPNKVVYVHARGSQSGKYITVGTEKLYMSTSNTTNDGKDVDVYGFIYGYSTQYSNTNFCVTSIAEDPTVPKLSVTPTSKTWESNETDAAVFTVNTNAEGENGWSISQDNLDWATVVVNTEDGIITVTPKGKNEEKTANEGTITVFHSVGTLSETITLTQKAAGEAVVKTYRHVFTAKPSTGNNVSLSGVSWKITATNLNGYNSNNYAGVQLGTKEKNGQITLTSPSAWSYTADGVTVTKIKEVRLWLNLGGTSVTPSVSIGGKAASSDGTTVTKNSTAKTDWTKTTKVTFTPAAGSDTGVIVIDVTSVLAGYICAIEIDAE